MSRLWKQHFNLETGKIKMYNVMTPNKILLRPFIPFRSFMSRLLLCQKCIAETIIEKRSRAEISLKLSTGNCF